MRFTRILKALSGVCLLLTATSTAYALELQDVNIENMDLNGTKTVVLTFDDGPGVGTSKILDLLKQYKVRATFFSVGQAAQAHPAKLARLVSEGHLLANHSFDHDKLDKEKYVRDPSLLVAQIRRTHDVLSPFLKPGQALFFRAPFGDWSIEVANQLNQDPVIRRYIGPIYWNVGRRIETSPEGKLTNAADWECWTKRAHLTVEQCAEGYLAKIESLKGGVVLMHDIHAKTAQLVELLLPALIEKGYRFKTLDQLSAVELYRLKKPYRTQAGRPVNF